MSKIQTVHTLYPAVDPANNTKGVDKYVHLIGPSWTDYMVSPSESSANNTGCSFSIRFSDKMTAIDPSSLIVELPVTITKIGALGVGNNPYNLRTEGFCCNPLHKIIRNLKISMDGIQYSYEVSKIIYAMECMDEVTHDKLQFNDGTNMLDLCQRYSNLYGSVSSPYALPSDNITQPNRSTHPITSVYDNVNTTVITSTLFLNMGFLSPFCKKQLYPLSSDELTINIDFETGHLNKMWRVDATNHPQPTLIPSITLGQPNLRYKLNQLPLGLKSPHNEIYQYNRVISRTQATTSAQIAAGGAFSLTSGVYELNRVPSLMVVYLSRAQSEFTTPLIDTTTADFFGKITGVNMNFGNRTNVFNTSTMYELYEMSRRRGLNSSITYGHFAGNFAGEVPGVSASGKGSILVFSPIFDVGGSGGEILTNGVIQKNVVRVEVNGVNLNNYATRFDLNVIEVYDGVITVDNNLAQIQESFGEGSREVVNTQKMEFPTDELRGGSMSTFFKSLWQKGRDIWTVIDPFLKNTKIISTMTKHIPVAGPAISSVAEKMGYGGYLPSQTIEGAGKKKRRA